KLSVDEVNTFLQKYRKLCNDVLDFGNTEPTLDFNNSPKKIMLIDFLCKFFVLKDPKDNFIDINNLESESFLSNYGGDGEYHIEAFTIKGFSQSEKENLSTFIKQVLNTKQVVHNKYQFVGA